MPEFLPNWNYILKEAASIAMIYVDEDIQKGAFEVQDDKRKVVNFQNPVEHPEELDKIRECNEVLLVLKACCKNNTAFERVLEQLGRQGIKVTAVVLTSVDDKLISAYYRSKK